MISQQPSEPRRKVYKRQVTIGVRFYDNKGFCNRVNNDTGDFTIEVLVGSSDAISQGIMMEIGRRRRIERHIEDLAIRRGSLATLDHLSRKRRDQQYWMLDSLDHPDPYGSFHSLDGGLRPDDLNHQSSSPQEALPVDKLGITGRIDTVRIRSARVVAVMTELDPDLMGPYGLNEGAFIFRRPFTWCFYWQEEIKKKFIELQSVLEEPGSEASTTTAQEPRKLSDEQALKKRAVEELQLYINFVDSYIMPLWKQFDEVGDKTPRSISYVDIPLLFRAGELAYLPPPANIRNNPNSGVQTVFKLVRSLHDGSLKGSNIIWSVYCLDYREGKYTPVWRKILFPKFDGLVNITELPCYPLKFHPDYSSLLTEQIRGGEHFRKCVEVGIRDIYYSGWALVTGMLPRSYDASNIPEPEHIESEVIIDFKEAVRQLPSALVETGDGPINPKDAARGSWSSLDAPKKRTSMGFLYGNPTEDFGLPQDRVWLESGSTENSNRIENYCLRADSIRCKMWREVEQRDKFLAGDEDISSACFQDEHLAILPKRLPGYVLRERKFAILHVMRFELHREVDETNLDSVQMSPEHKRIIKSAVAAHFQKRHRERIHRNIVRGVDLVRGKGNGLVILLHGPPGTGKTLTAEAVALENSKPLFPITCGDLGFTPEKVEQSLKDIFRYAHLWDCILLLDEADVFLARRNLTDIQRNALVSVFLRVLEYYSGILFLTTNRVGAIDEAFRSRIHISLNYKHLDCDDTIAILDTYLKRLPRHNPSATSKSNRDDAHGGIVLEGTAEGPGMIIRDHEIRSYIRQEWHEYAAKHNRERGPWNGRQIRNAVHIATCLAMSEDQLDNSTNDGGDGEEAGSKIPTVLTADHFRAVGKTTDEFDAYMKRVRRADADTMARMAGERDDFTDEETYVMARSGNFGFSGQEADHHRQHPDLYYPSAAAGPQQGAQSRRGKIGRKSQRVYSGRAGPQQQRSLRSLGEEYKEYGPAERARTETDHFQGQNRIPRGMKSSRGAATTSVRRPMAQQQAMPGIDDGEDDEDEYEDECEPETVDGRGEDEYDEYEREEDDHRPRSKVSLHHAAVNQNRGYAWHRKGAR
ncbi:hypothetical protein A9Z42_0009310 [Trichoderma parareesei]|uniref:AAA+ ATPase domain-containing protein n=1 Tax=Trichoderma parareesei TaxID=858221 RepID=A0A2H2ZMW7_TRIPA|nr:hypothetical protein A9Z42_0009310 [Trichoderma parareesei]